MIGDPNFFAKTNWFDDVRDPAAFALKLSFEYPIHEHTYTTINGKIGMHFASDAHQIPAVFVFVVGCVLKKHHVGTVFVGVI